MHKLIVEDSTECFTAKPDYVLIFKKNGENKIPVTHPVGLTYYAGANPMLPELAKKYGTFEQLKAKYKNWKDAKTNKLSHIIWQRYASAVWDDIRIGHVLKYKPKKEEIEDGEKHLHPTQLDFYYRITELYSNPGEVVADWFLGVGSGVVAACEMGRKGIGIELKPEYYAQCVKNLKTIKKLDFDTDKNLFTDDEDVLEENDDF